MKAKNPKYESTAADVITQIQTIMNNKNTESFDDLRTAIPELTGKPDNIVQQAVQDAGFEVVQDK